MRVRRLDSNHDWTFGQGINNYARESEAIAQCVKTRLWSFVNDWFLNLEHGMDWLYLKEKANLDAIELAVKKQVLQTKGVVRITDYHAELDPNSRVITISVDYLDIYGERNRATAEK
ncbi:hypothetical protein [Haemophilus parahaemolyticus]|uniref:hypothetical protein n=1 Tax=Haemophilus parahaemolyticus TaxID=735 RepID=UPI002053FE69|nr:hypothetical protein [Haemophilus parahaemolyticus]DAW07770.1 MAG TPA: baseplate wedge protein [Caudoviricetes sp.]